MKQRINSFFHSILFKLELLFVLLSVPLFLLGSSIYRWGYGLVTEEIKNASISQTTLYAKSIGDELSRIHLLATEYMNEEDLNYLVNAHSIMDQFEYFQYMTRVQTRLEVLKNSSTLIDTIDVHIPSLNKTISSEKGVLLLSDHWEQVVDNCQNTDNSGIILKDNRILYDMTYPLFLSPEKTPLFVLEIRLSNNAIREILSGFSSHPESTVYFTSADHTYLLSTLGTAAASELPGFLFQLPAAGSGSLQITDQGIPMVLTYTNLTDLNMQLASLTPTEQIYGKINDYQKLFLCYIVLFILVLILFAWFILRVIHKPVKQLVKGFQQLEAGNFGTLVSYSNADEFQYLYQSFNHMSQNLQELIQQMYEQKILVQNAELKQLQSQINPHFLYNSFFNIYRMAKDEDYEHITAFSQYLGSYYEYITRNAAMEATLRQEYDHALTYCQIQEMRFRNRLTLNLSILPEEVQHLLVPRLILQPILENAFQHGLKDVEYPEIRLDFHLENRTLKIRISNNGRALPEADFQALLQKLNSASTTLETTAIINIHRRLQLKFGSDAGLSLSQGEAADFLVTLTIPTT